MRDSEFRNAHFCQIAMACGTRDASVIMRSVAKFQREIQKKTHKPAFTQGISIFLFE